jgi:hypothetical protein
LRVILSGAKNPSVPIHVIRGCFLFLALSAASVSAAELTIIRVFTVWRDAASFKRISEYFDGRENTGGATVLRTHPDQRAGCYFLVRIANPGAPAAVKINVQMITPTESRPKTHTFETNLKSGETVLNLGLTGADWPDAKANPVAWKLDVVAADGRVLATEKSYLWDKPAAK